MNLDYYIIYFICLSFVGYVYETLAMTLWSGSFENRGFLIGPIIPIYGVGAVAATFVLTYQFPSLPWWQIFLLGVVCSAIIEYPTHYLLEKVFHRTWWDYTNAPLNIHGRVCLPAALGFGVAAVLIVRVINPFLLPLLFLIPEQVADGIALVLTILFTIDMTLTISIISDFEMRVEEAENRFDENVGNIINPIINTEKPIKDHFYQAVDKTKQIPTGVKEKMQGATAKVQVVKVKATDKVQHATAKVQGATSMAADHVKSQVQNAMQKMSERRKNFSKFYLHVVNRAIKYRDGKRKKFNFRNKK